MPRPPAECGTVAGYNRHRRAGEHACDRCRQANTDYQRDYAARRLAALGEEEHGTPTAYRYGCRCDRCRPAGAAIALAAKQRLTGGEPPRHGTEHAYYRYRCRCRECVGVVYRLNSMRRREPRRPLPADDRRHGTRVAYDYHGCRCDRCRDAHAARVARRRGGAAPPPRVSRGIRLPAELWAEVDTFAATYGYSTVGAVRKLLVAGLRVRRPAGGLTKP